MGRMHSRCAFDDHGSVTWATCYIGCDKWHGLLGHTSETECKRCSWKGNCSNWNVLTKSHTKIASMGKEQSVIGDLLKSTSLSTREAILSTVMPYRYFHLWCIGIFIYDATHKIVCPWEHKTKVFGVFNGWWAMVEKVGMRLHCL